MTFFGSNPAEHGQQRVTTVHPPHSYRPLQRRYNMAGKNILLFGRIITKLIPQLFPNTRDLFENTQKQNKQKKTKKIQLQHLSTCYY